MESISTKTVGRTDRVAALAKPTPARKAKPVRKYRIIRGKRYWFLEGQELVPDPFELGL